MTEESFKLNEHAGFQAYDCNKEYLRVSQEGELVHIEPNASEWPVNIRPIGILIERLIKQNEELRNTRSEPVRKVQINDAQAESDEETALQLATWLRTDGPDDRELNLASAVWLEEIADRIAERRAPSKVKLPDCFYSLEADQYLINGVIECLKSVGVGASE